MARFQAVQHPCMRLGRKDWHGQGWERSTAGPLAGHRLGLAPIIDEAPQPLRLTQAQPGKPQSMERIAIEAFWKPVLKNRSCSPFCTAPMAYKRGK